MKRWLIKGVFILLMSTCPFLSARGIEPVDNSDEEVGQEEALLEGDDLNEPNDHECENLQEAVNIFVPLQATVSDEFAKISDLALCDSMMDQCDYFSNQAKKVQKEYRARCDSDYEIVPLAKCDYDATPCVKRIHHLVLGGLIR